MLPNSTPIQEFVFYDKYSRFNYDLGRRETWEETIDRVHSFLLELSDNQLSQEEYDQIKRHLLAGTVSPSMRLMATAGPAAKRNPLLLYNCAYLPVVSLPCFSEVLWLSMSGVGVGYSVEQKYTRLLPRVSELDTDSIPVKLQVMDSAEGWVEAFNLAIHLFFAGIDVDVDYSQLRPAGAPLRTKGGQASGPGPLKDLIDTSRNIIFSAAGRQLRPIEIFDLLTTVGSCAVSGGVRRSAQIAMFTFGDNEMRHAKDGAFWEHHPNRANANISAVWEEPLLYEEVSSQMQAMFDGHSGEPGIVSRYAMNVGKPDRRRELVHGGTNPCGEIFLHGSTSSGKFGGQLCNLSSVNVKSQMTVSEVIEAAKVAAIIGTIQAAATNFELLREEWREICEEERLIGVSLVGLADNPQVLQPEALVQVKAAVIEQNLATAADLGINSSPATTCVKPAGNSSVMYGTARGINARYAPYYIRRVRVGAKSPLVPALFAAGVPLSPENGYDSLDSSPTLVASFFEASPPMAITTSELSAIDQLNIWQLVRSSFTEHNPSVTIEYLPHEEQDVISWVDSHQDIIGGLSFLPKSTAVYRQAPYEEITEEAYRVSPRIHIDWSLIDDGGQDNTKFDLECSGGVCDLR